MRRIPLLVLVVLSIAIAACVNEVPGDAGATDDPDTGDAGDPSDDALDDAESEPSDDVSDAADGTDPDGTQVTPDGEELPLGSFTVEYYDNDDFTGLFETTTDDRIDEDWELDAPLEGMGENYFSVRWSGRFEFEEDEYTFTASVDDGIRIIVDGDVVLESWENQPDTRYDSGPIELTAGEHEIIVEYYEAYSSASVEVSWAPTGEATIDPSRPSFDGTYGARPVARSKTPSSSDTFVAPDGSGSSCTQSSPCSLREGLTNSGYIWLTPGTYTPGSRVYINSDRIVESIDPNDKAIIDFRDAVNGISVGGNDNVLRNFIVRRSSGVGVFVSGNNNLIEGVTSEHNYHSGFQVYRSWGMDVDDTSKGSFNVFRDCIANYNNDDCCAKSCGATSCTDSDSDGIGFSAGVGNVIDHCEAFYNTDDGYDFWKSYKSTITNSIAGRNGYDDLTGFENRIRRGNGNGFKMGGGGVDGNDGDTDNGHIVIGNWAYENAANAYVRNSGTGQVYEDNVCGSDKESCNWSY